MSLTQGKPVLESPLDRARNQKLDAALLPKLMGVRHTTRAGGELIRATTVTLPRRLRAGGVFLRSLGRRGLIAVSVLTAPAGTTAARPALSTATHHPTLLHLRPSAHPPPARAVFSRIAGVSLTKSDGANGAMMGSASAERCCSTTRLAKGSMALEYRHVRIKVTLSMHQTHALAQFVTDLTHEWYRTDHRKCS